MSLRKSPTLTPALLAACRRNARKSTGPRTAQGKANTRMNALREAGRSRLFREFAQALFYAPPGGVQWAVRELLTPDLARLGYFAKHAELMMEADLPDEERHRIWKSILSRKPKRDSLLFMNKARILLKTKAQKK